MTWLDLDLNFDESVCFPQVESLLSVYKNALQCFNKAYVSDESTFQQSILNQPLWGNKYITHYVGCKKSVLFLRNWIRSGVRIVSDLPFTNGILDENAMYTMLDNKKNMYCEVMLIKTALYPYRMNIVNGNNESLIPIKPLTWKEYYNVFIQQCWHVIQTSHLSLNIWILIVMAMMKFWHFQRKLCSRMK